MTNLVGRGGGANSTVSYPAPRAGAGSVPLTGDVAAAKAAFDELVSVEISLTARLREVESKTAVDLEASASLDAEIRRHRLALRHIRAGRPAAIEALSSVRASALHQRAATLRAEAARIQQTAIEAWARLCEAEEVTGTDYSKLALPLKSSRLEIQARQVESEANALLRHPLPDQGEQCRVDLADATLDLLIGAVLIRESTGPSAATVTAWWETTLARAQAAHPGYAGPIRAWLYWDGANWWNRVISQGRPRSSRSSLRNPGTILSCRPHGALLPRMWTGWRYVPTR